MPFLGGLKFKKIININFSILFKKNILLPKTLNKIFHLSQKTKINQNTHSNI